VRLAATALMVGATALGMGGCGGPANGGGTGAGQGDVGPVQHPTALVGETGKNDSFAFSLSDENGAPITNLAAGTYKLTVHDYSSIHNFHLAGAGVDALTGVGDKGDRTFTVTFKPGTYTFICDPHVSEMNGHFRVS
jgi:Copper binding proteins, plastocyanin/azurin family